MITTERPMPLGLVREVTLLFRCVSLFQFLSIYLNPF